MKTINLHVLDCAEPDYKGSINVAEKVFRHTWAKLRIIRDPALHFVTMEALISSYVEFEIQNAKTNEDRARLATALNARISK